MANASILKNLRVLVVEDEMAISLLIEDILQDEECNVIGPYHRVPAALEAARNEPIDLAILDVNIAGERVFPVAEVLSARGVPFLFLSGYGRTALPPEHRDWKVCNKPFKPEALVDMLREQARNRKA
jgi:DNA-binding response OmpR family regulator